MRFLLSIFLLSLIGCSSCVAPKVQKGEASCVVSPPPPPSPVIMAPQSEVEHPHFKKLGGIGAKLELSETVVSKVTKEAKAPSKLPAKTSTKSPVSTKEHETTTLINVRHPDHFYKNIWSQVSITLGSPLSYQPGVVELSDSVPSALAYSIFLKGEPIDQFEIRQGEQIVSAPRNKLTSSSVYFDVKPLSSGKKTLVYQVKVRKSIDDPGVGLPEVSKEITVEVNRASLVSTFSDYATYFWTFLGGLGSVVGGWIIKKWLDRKATS